MFQVIDKNLRQANKIIVLWGHGWKRRAWMSNRMPVTQWRDPHSGLWYEQKTAVKLLKVQALDQLHLK